MFVLVRSKQVFLLVQAITYETTVFDLPTGILHSWLGLAAGPSHFAAKKRRDENSLLHPFRATKPSSPANAQGHGLVSETSVFSHQKGTIV
jgi:hypothetical protein